MKCGNGHQHQTVAEVRACYGIGGEAATPTHRPNKYDGKCEECGGKVEAGQGRIDRGEQGWEVRHLAGQCPEKPAKIKAGPFPQVPQGYYATPSATGNNDLDFWFVKRPTEGTWAGRTFVSRVIGGRADASVRGATARAALEAILKMGFEASGDRFADELGHCKRCNRHLTDELSRQRRMGPDCWGQQAA